MENPENHEGRDFGGKFSLVKSNFGLPKGAKNWIKSGLGPDD